MRIIARIALKNLIRQRARFLLVLLVGVLGIVILTLIGGYYEFIYYGLRESLIRSHYAHLVIRNRDFTSSELINPFVKMIENPDSLIQKIEKQPNVILASERIRSWGIISTRSGRTSNIKIRGIVPEKEMLINTFVRSRKGKELNAESNYEIEVGAALAKKLELKVDDEVVISAITSNNIHNAMNMRVKAIVGSFSVEFDEILVKMPISIAQELFEVDMVQEIVVLLKSTSYAPRFRRMVQREILEKKDDLEAVLWSEQAGFFRQVVMFFNGYYKLIISAVMVVIFFTSVITARMSYYKRLPEFGVMKAIGSTQVDLLKMVVYEALFLGVFSIILGFLVSLAIKMLVDTVGGIPMPNPPGANYDLTVGIKLNSTILTMAASIALLVPLTASLLSYISFARLSVVDLIYNTHNDL